MTFDNLAREAAGLLDLCRAAGVRLVSAESCTGGLIAALLTETAGSSEVFERGFVTYSNTAKTALLGVPPAMIDAEGAVSEAVAKAMAEGALSRSNVEIAVSVTGVAGPGGGTVEKPVGLVHFGLAVTGSGPRHCERRFGPLTRRDIRFKSVETAFAMIREAVNKTGPSR